MTYKFCPHCAAKNFFEIEPKFCCSCGEPLNAVVVASSGAPSMDDSTSPVDSGGFRKPAKLDVDIDIPEESWEKFGENIGTAPDENYQRDSRPEFRKDVPIRQVLLEDRQLKKGTIGGDD